MPITDFKTSPQKEVQGFRLEMTPNKDNTIPVVILSRMAPNNRRYQVVVEAVRRKHGRAIDMETISQDVSDKLVIEIFCKGVIVGWEHIQPDDDGKDLAFSVDAAIELLSRPEYNDLYRYWRDEAAKAANFVEAKKKEIAKN